MSKRLRRSLLALIALAGSTGNVPSALAALPADGRFEAASDQAQICRRADGTIRSVATDVLVLLDNSQSLSSNDRLNRKGKDPEGRRFEALRRFLESYGSGATTDQVRNFGLVTFGTGAQVVVPMTTVTSREDASRIFDDIQNRVPNTEQSQEKHTNYVTALEAAIDVFNDSDPTNTHCRVVVWFTDGVFDTNNSKASADAIDDANRLRRAVCSPDGLGRAFGSSDINTFVVFLSKDDPGNPRMEASKDAMVKITGDYSPSFGDGEGDGDRVFADGQCTREGGDRHLGEVISVQEVDSVIGYLTDLGPLIDGGERVFDGECPVNGTLASMPLLDGNLIEWLAVTTWDESRSITAETISIRSASGGETRPLLDVFSESNVGSSERSVRLVPRDVSARTFLAAGWRLQVSDAGRVCVRIRPRDLSFVIKKDLSIVSTEGIPPALFANGRLTFLKDGATIDIDGALESLLVDGELRVDNGDFLPKRGVLPVAVSVDGSFRIEPAGCGMFANYAGVEVPRGNVRTSECTLTPATTGDTSVDASGVLSELRAKCLDVGWVITKDGEPQSPQFGLEKGSGSVRIGIRTNEDLPNRRVSCGEISSSVLVGSDGETAKIASRVSLDLIRRGNPALALALAVSIAIVASILSLLLLRLINHLLGRTVESSRFYFYEIPIRILAKQGQKPVYEVLPNPSKRQKADHLAPLRSDGSRRSLTAGPLVFSRRLPGMLSPFGEARLVLTSGQVAGFWQTNSRGDGLRLAFPRALVVWAEKTRGSGDVTNIDALLTAIVPRTGRFAGVDGAEAVIAERSQELCEALHAQFVLLRNESKTVDETRPAGSSVSAGPPGTSPVGESPSRGESAAVIPADRSGPPGPPGPPRY